MNYRVASLVSMLFWAACQSAGAGETKVLTLRENDAAVLLLDRLTTSQPNVIRRKRPAVKIPGNGPGSVMVTHPDESPDKWTEVRWVFRFPTKEIGKPVQQAILYLWGQSKSGQTRGKLSLALIRGAQGDTVNVEDRTVEEVGSPVEIPFPESPGPIELDVTWQVNQAVKERFAYASFRISADSEAPKEGGEAGRYYFGGLENTAHWPGSQPPQLELTLP